MEMKISVNGLRMNMIRDYNNLIRKISESLEENVDSFSEKVEFCRDIEEAMDDIRSDICFLLCLYEPDNEDFSEMSEKAKSLFNFEDFIEEES